MDTQAIRKKILDLALRGKLTEQLPEDGTGEDLYQQIQQEKLELGKTGIVKKAKPLPPVSEEEMPFCIPDNWKWVRIGEIGTTITGGTPAKDHPEYYGGKYPFFKPSDLDAGRHISIASEYLTEQGKKESRQISKGSILVCCIGSIGKSAIIDIDGTANQQINALIPVLCDSDYVQFTIEDSAFQQQLNQGSRATTVSIINKSKFDNCIIPFPPLAEQKRIVNKIKSVFAILDTIDTLQSQYQDNLATLKSKIIDAGIQGKLTEQLPEDGTAEELYQQIQQEKLALEKAGKIKKSKPLPPISDEEKPFDIPESWKWVKLGNVITLVSGTDFKPEDYNDAGIGMPYMTGASNIENDKLIINRWTPCPKNIAHEGELLLVCKGSGFGKLVICNVSEAHIARQFMSIRPYRGVDVNYVKALMTNSFQIIKEAGKGLIPGVDRDTVLNIPLPLPPLAEQKRIVAKLEELLAVCEG